MRRSLAGITVLAMLLLPVRVLADVSVSATYKDTFSTGGYAGSHGSLAWQNPWTEIGEGDGPDDGAVYVDSRDDCASGECLHIEGEGELVVLLGIMRYADLSMFTTAELSYDVKRLFDEDLNGTAKAELLVQVSADGASWTTVKNLGLETTDGAPIQKSHTITKWISKGFAVRYVVTGTLGSEVFVDNVEIKGELPMPTTTTTTKPTTTTTTSTSTTTPGTTTTTIASTGTTIPGTMTTTTTSTSTTTPATTTTTADEDNSNTAGVVPTDGPPPGSGIREADTGMQADYDGDLFGTMEMEKPSVLGIELSADYLIAVEVIEASWMWMLGLGLIIAWAIVSNVERKRPDKGLAES